MFATAAQAALAAWIVSPGMSDVKFCAALASVLEPPRLSGIHLKWKIRYLPDGSEAQVGYTYSEEGEAGALCLTFLRSPGDAPEVPLRCIAIWWFDIIGTLTKTKPSSGPPGVIRHSLCVDMPGSEPILLFLKEAA